jgi:hypothetical protein
MSTKDDDKRPRRHQTQTERDVAALHRRRTQPGGIPVEIDPEMTPAPAEPPAPDRFAAMSREERDLQLLKIATDAAAVANHEQNVRKEGREMGQLMAKVEALDGFRDDIVRLTAIMSETCLPAIRGMGEDLKMIMQSRSTDIAQRDQQTREMLRALKDIAQDVGGIDTRAARLELDMGKFNTELRLLSQRVDAMNGNLTDRMGKAEREIDSLKTKTNTLDTKQKITVALTRRDKTKIGGLSAVAGALASGVAWLIQHLFKG